MDRGGVTFQRRGTNIDHEPSTLVILRGMTHRVGPKGQVVIPKELRDALGFSPGDDVVFWREGDHVALRKDSPGSPLRGRHRGRRLAEALERDRAAERVRDRSR